MRWIDLAAETGWPTETLRSIARRAGLRVGPDDAVLDELTEDVLRRAVPASGAGPSAKPPSRSPIVCVFCDGTGEDVCRRCGGNGLMTRGVRCDRCDGRGVQDCVGPCMGGGLLPPDGCGVSQEWLKAMAATYAKLRLLALTGPHGRHSSLVQAVSTLDGHRTARRRAEHTYFATIAIAITEVVARDGNTRLLSPDEEFLIAQIHRHALNPP